MRSSILILGLGVVAVAACGGEREQDVAVAEGEVTAPLSVARVLNGQMLLAPCTVDIAPAVCATIRSGSACPVSNPDPALRGALLTDRTVTLGGVRGRQYTITLRIQGEVESKQYPGSVDRDRFAMSPAADGFAIGGHPTTADAYNVYLIRVTNPGSTTSTDYFLNSLQPPGVSNHTTYGVDYTAQIGARGGATIRLVASDSNCAEIKNCGPVPNNGNICATPIVLPQIDPMARSLNPTFNFNTPYNGQWISMVVTHVSTP